MPTLRTQLQKHRRSLLALAAAAACLLLVVLVWAAAVRPQAGKSLSAYISDDYSASTVVEAGQSISQSFAFDEGALALGFVFFTGSEQPQGTLELTVADAGSGAVLARSTGEMGLILPGQYTVLGLDTPLPAVSGQRYTVTLTPRYSGDGRLAVGHSAGAALWQDDAVLDGAALDGTLSLLISYRRIGGFLTRFFLLVGLAVCAVVFFGVRAALAGRLDLPRAVFTLVAAFGLLYGTVLPPYAAPDEKYHINQSFTLATKWVHVLTGDPYLAGHIPATTSYRREHDFNALLQDEHTTVFTWQALAGDLFTRSPDSFDSAVELEELQVDAYFPLYLPSAAAVFLCYLLRLGFVPTLVLGRLVNLLLFAALAAWAVRRAPFGRRVFAAAALLPMTLHLAASFSRDALLLGLCFAFTALCLEALFDRAGGPLPARRLLGLAACGILLAPAKVVYLPLALLALAIPAARLGARAGLKKGCYLAACLAAVLTFDHAFLTERLAPAAPAQDGGGTVAALALTDVPADPAEAMKENTVENYVRRLYYWAEDRADVPDSEIAFWAQALRDGDVTPAVLAQSFFFSPALYQQVDEQEYAARISQVFLLHDALAAEEKDPYLIMPYQQVLDESGLVQLFKRLYTNPYCVSLFDELGLEIGTEDGVSYPLDRAELAAGVEAARAARATQSTAAADDRVTYTPGYILAHPVQTLLLAVRSVLQNGDHYLRGLVGGSLSYYSLDLAWGWVLALYLLLAFAACPAGPDDASLPAGRGRAAGLLAAAVCAALTVGGCILWTPRSHETIYGLQGRYFLPLLPLLLSLLPPRGVRLPDAAGAECRLTGALCLVNAGVLVNIMLAVIAR